jgi:hypothetical protein
MDHTTKGATESASFAEHKTRDLDKQAALDRRTVAQFAVFR